MPLMNEEARIIVDVLPVGEPRKMPAYLNAYVYLQENGTLGILLPEG